jgi:hypothetical protein
MSSANQPEAPGVEPMPARAGVGAGSHVSLLSALVLAALPKCPMCLAAYGGLLAALGSSSWLAAVWGLPLTTVALLVALGALAFPARRRRQYGPLLLAVLGASVLLLGKFLFAAPSAVYAGPSLLAAASVWNSMIPRIPRRDA